MVTVAPLTLNLVPAVYSHDEMRPAALPRGRFHQVNGWFALKYGCFRGAGLYRDLPIYQFQAYIYVFNLITSSP